jgi:hypothetical protein
MRRGRVVSYRALFVGDPSGGKTWPEWNELLTSRLSGQKLQRSPAAPKAPLLILQHLRK